MKSIINKNIELNFINKNNIKEKFLNKHKVYKIFSFILLFIILFFIYFKSLKNFLRNNEKDIYLDEYDINSYNFIKTQLEKSKCSIMNENERKFLNGVIRRFKPKKIVEIGVLKGGSSIIMLNALNDIKNSHLYSIDLRSGNKIGFCVKKFFPNLIKNWSLFKGNIVANFIEKIGKDIDMVFIDTSHFEPGEILDFIMVFPFLKEEDIVGFHDISLQLFSYEPNKRNEWVPYIIFNLIRGKKYLPSGINILKQNIGAIKLDVNQKNYIHDYFRALGGQWQYFPKEEHIILIRNFIKKYFDIKCLIIFEEAVKFNRKFVLNNPKEEFYKDFYKKFDNSI